MASEERGCCDSSDSLRWSGKVDRAWFLHYQDPADAGEEKEMIT